MCSHASLKQAVNFLNHKEHKEHEGRCSRSENNFVALVLFVVRAEPVLWHQAFVSCLRVLVVAFAVGSRVL
jgi:hypothetical protein